MTNAFNLTDGLDGLATRIALVVLASTLITASDARSGHLRAETVELRGARGGSSRCGYRPPASMRGDTDAILRSRDREATGRCIFCGGDRFDPVAERFGIRPLRHATADWRGVERGVVATGRPPARGMEAGVAPAGGGVSG